MAVTTAPGFADDGVTLSENATSVATGLAGMPRLAGWVVMAPSETGGSVADAVVDDSPALGSLGTRSLGGWLVDEPHAASAATAIATDSRFQVSTDPGCPIRAAAVEGVPLHEPRQLLCQALRDHDRDDVWEA